VQTFLANRKSGRQGARSAEALLAVRRKRQRLVFGLGAVVVLVVAAIVSVSKFGSASPGETLENTQCEVKPFREDEAARLIKDGAVLVYNRTAGPLCVDELLRSTPMGVSSLTMV
jgi:hypothetical protein